MKLTFARPHASITHLPQGLELGKLTVITGRNGSGKSQLLEAIELGHVTADVASVHQVYRRDWHSFVPTDVAATPNRRARQDRLDKYKTLQELKSSFVQLFTMAGQHDLVLKGNTTRANILALSVSDLAGRLGDPETAETVWNDLRSADDADNANFRNYPGIYSVLRPLADSLGKSALDLTAKDVDQDVLTTWGMTPFQATFVPHLNPEWVSHAEAW